MIVNCSTVGYRENAKFLSRCNDIELFLSRPSGKHDGSISESPDVTVGFSLITNCVLRARLLGPSRPQGSSNINNSRWLRIRSSNQSLSEESRGAKRPGGFARPTRNRLPAEE